MKKLTAIIAICLIGCITQAQPSTCTASTASVSTGKGQSEKGQKQFDPQEILSKIDKALTERQAELQKATSNGRTDIANALQKIITDLNSMKTALNNKDRDAFKTANEQREKDREALESLRKSDRQENKHENKSGSTTQPSAHKL